jgi:O-acetyl-ADP-ribose deacetylase (regulator of RNase III)
MIHFTTGNILKSDAEALVNTVNTVGIMGKGIALAFKNKFPENYRIYRQACDNKELPGVFHQNILSIFQPNNIGAEIRKWIT